MHAYDMLRGLDGEPLGSRFTVLWLGPMLRSWQLQMEEYKSRKDGWGLEKCIPRILEIPWDSWLVLS